MDHIKYTSLQIGRPRTSFDQTKRQPGLTKLFLLVRKLKIPVRDIWDISGFLIVSPTMFIIAGQQQNEMLVKIFLQRFQIWLWVVLELWEIKYLPTKECFLMDYETQNCVTTWSQVYCIFQHIKFPAMFQENCRKKWWNWDESPAGTAQCQYKNSQ